MIAQRGLKSLFLDSDRMTAGNDTPHEAVHVPSRRLHSSMETDGYRLIYLAISLDGYIAGPAGDMSWLDPYAESGEDTGFTDLLDRVDAVVMGRRTFEFVEGTGQWPYTKPVFVLRSSPISIPERLAGKIQFLGGSPAGIIKTLEQQGYMTLYIDGGKVIRDFLAADLIQEMTLTRVPLLLGKGVELFEKGAVSRSFRHVETRSFPTGLVMSRYLRTASAGTEPAANGSGQP